MSLPKLPMTTAASLLLVSGFEGGVRVLSRLHEVLRLGQLRLDIVSQHFSSCVERVLQELGQWILVAFRRAEVAGGVVERIVDQLLQAAVVRLKGSRDLGTRVIVEKELLLSGSGVEGT